MKTKLKVLSLFSGVGMFDYGLERVTRHKHTKQKVFETVAMVEIDEDCQRVLRNHWPTVSMLDDVKKVFYTESCFPSFHLYELDSEGTWCLAYDKKIDVVTASWPCQGHSVAGKKKGLNDERSGLWKETKRILSEVKPAWFIGENSANLRTTGLVEVLQDLREIGFSHIEWHILPACAFGAVHRRERIYIIAHRDGLRSGIQTIARKDEKFFRRAKARFVEHNRSRPKSKFYGVGDGPSTWMDRRGDGGYRYIESERKRRVKQCGNSLYWPIVSFIGECILEYEKE